jgi:hypothetical protein
MSSSARIYALPSKCQQMKAAPRAQPIALSPLGVERLSPLDRSLSDTSKEQYD